MEAAAGCFRRNLARANFMAGDHAVGEFTSGRPCGRAIAIGQLCGGFSENLSEIKY
jgi:hypothetical protein